MDVDNDVEYMNAAAAHAAFVTTVSAASMYWLLRRAQHARDINIHQLQTHFPKKIGLGRSADFLHSEHPFYGINKNSSGDKIANVKLPEFAEITQNNAIMPFKAIQGHRF